MIAVPRDYSEGVSGVDWDNPVTRNLDNALLFDGTRNPRDWASMAHFAAKGGFVNPAIADAGTYLGIDKFGHSAHSASTHGSTDTFELTQNTAYGTQHSALVIANFDTIVGSAFPRLWYIDNGASTDIIQMFGRHTTHVLIVQTTIGGAGVNFTTSAAAFTPGTPVALGFTANGSAAFTPTVYVDGRAAATTGGPTAAGITTGASQRHSICNVFGGSAGVGMQGHIFAAFHWNRALSAPEMKWASDNWFDMFKRVRA